ncbi:MAG: hypothetical protein KTR29_17415 [Rhodothermaceae bacterium]|nr:hypothetical protein [Rhodothermaceae bacterium]
MKSALLLFSILFGFASTKTIAQDIVQQYPIHNHERNTPQGELFGSLDQAMRMLDDSLRTISYAFSDVGNTRYHLFHLTEVPVLEDAIDIDQALNGKLVLIRRDEDQHLYQQWTVPFQAYPMSYTNPRLMWDRSTIFLHRDIPFIKLFYGINNDFTNRGYVQFYVARADSLSSLGSIALYDNDDPSGFMEHELYEGELLPFTASSKGIHITLNRTTFSTYPIEYLLTTDSLTLLKDHKPEFHISTEQAQEKLNALFDEYYSEYWKTQPHESRAEHFRWPFFHLALQRSDFAPAHYNLACMLAQIGNSEDAIGSLRRAFMLDSTYVEKAKQDSDLRSLRDLSEFQVLFE